MHHDFSLKLLAGGRHACTPEWDKPRDDLDQCHKVYLPLSGRAFLSDEHGEHTLTPGNLYLISGYAIRSQRCPTRMDLRWVHFVPTSYHLRRRLDALPMLAHWPVAEFDWIRATLDDAEALFENPEGARESRLAENAPMSLACRVEAAILYLISLRLEAEGHDAPEDAPGMERLRTAITYMDNHYRDNPTLADMAASANLAPNYFHRLFSAVMGQTPFEYIESRRLETAMRLLADPRASIKRIADSCGYADPLYFSRAFRRRFGAPPATVRKTLRITP